MIEKQFIRKRESIINTQTDELVNASSEESAEIITDWLNDLYNKYAEVRKENYGNLDGINYYQEENASQRERISDLKYENEQLKQEKHEWLQQKARYEQQYTEYIRENKNLKGQLYSDEDGICNQCKYHYLVKDEDCELGYYNSRCKKGHYECARVSLRHCKDFEIKNGDVK